jgi:prepilin-type N-terminal cleavage/methylation domain-containing protein
MKSSITNQRGFTLVEMLIALLILGLVSTAGLSFYTREHAQLQQQVDVSDTQQGVRSVMEEITRKIRLAGYRVYGSNALTTLNNNTWLALQYHDGTRIRTELFFPFTNTATGHNDLMCQMDGEAMQVFAEGIDSVKFTPGGMGLGTEWVTVDLVARTDNPGFRSTTSYGTTDSTRYLYRKLSSVVKLRNR